MFKLCIVTFYYYRASEGSFFNFAHSMNNLAFNSLKGKEKAIKHFRTHIKQCVHSNRLFTLNI